MIQIDQKRLDAVTENGSLYLYTPAEAASYYVQDVEELLAAPVIDYGTPLLDRHITPLRPGEQPTVVIARPGGGKTSLMIYMARRHAMRITAPNRCVIYVTWEETIESIEMSIEAGRDYTAEQVAWGTVDMERVKRGAVKRVDLPIFIIGQSSMKDRYKRKPPLTLDRVHNTILALYYEFGIEPTLICFDYLQKIPVLKGRNRMDEVTEAMFSTSELTKVIRAPFLVGVQASRDVDDQGLPIPSLGSGQWASVIEQEAFRMLGLLRPVTMISKNGSPLEDITIANRSYGVDKNLMIIRLLKQRKYFPPLSIYPVHFQPDIFELSDYDY